MASPGFIEGGYVLGIDMGTTSIKIVVVHIQSKDVVYEYSEESTDAYIVNNDTRSEQNVERIIDHLDACVASVPRNLANEIIGIGVCGQVHGVVCWNSESKPWKSRPTIEGHSISSSLLTPHYNWQDNRCCPEFIASLPEPDSHLTVHTGYGCCTLFWLMRNSPEVIENLNSAGTISDFVVAMLCDLSTPKMSPQSAASWGYFDTESEEWNKSTLKCAAFPVRLLPHIAQAGTVAGQLKEAWHNIPAGIAVGVALGDTHAAIFAALKDDNHAFCNISTSAQLVYVAKNFRPSSGDQKKSAAKIVPYFDGKYLVEGASLNGGNALSLFVSNFHKFHQDLGASLPKDVFWLKLIEDTFRTTNMDTDDLIFYPTFLGERQNPQLRAKIENIKTDNFDPIHIFSSLCAGVIANIRSIVPVQTLKEQQITKIVATGSALLRNKVLKMELEKQYPFPIEYTPSRAYSPYGAALSLLNALKLPNN